MKLYFSLNAAEKADIFHSNEIKGDSVTVVIATPLTLSTVTQNLNLCDSSHSRGGVYNDRHTVTGRRKSTPFSLETAIPKGYETDPF